MTMQARAPAPSPDTSPPPRSDWWFAVAAIAGAAALIVVVSVLAYTQLPPAMRRHPTPLETAPSGFRWLQAFAWWDGAWYAGIAREGYSFSLGARHQLPVVFFPAYPLLVRALTRVGGNTVVDGFLLSLACGMGAAAVFFQWCRDHLSPRAARLALGCLLVYPGAFYLFGTLYADAMYLLFALAAFVLLERDRPLAAGLAAALAAATRPTGLVLIAGLWLLAIERRGGLGVPGRRRFDLSVLRRRDAGLLLAPTGVAAYALFLGVRFGNPLLFLEAESGWHQSPGWRTWLKFSWFGRMFKPPYLEPHHFHLLGHLLVAIVAGALVVVVFRRFGVAYGVYAATVVGLSAVSTKDFVGLGRYVLAAFPCFAVAGELLAERPRARGVVLGTSAVLLLFLTHLHARNMLIS
ncbi:MAG: hypothetical protein ACRD12_16620 [Acidimicrobiales bacterium]